MYDKQLIIKRFAHSLELYDRLAQVQSDIAHQLASSLYNLNLQPGKILEIGSGTGFLTHRLSELYPTSDITALDIVDRSQKYLPSSVNFLCADAESTDLQRDNDLIASASAVQWFEDLEKFISGVITATKPGGIIAISTFGPENFREITATTGETLRYYDLEALSALFSPLEIIESREWLQTLKFETPIDVLRHIKATGVNALTPTRWTKEKLNKFCQLYIEKFGEATLTFHPQIVIAQKR